MPDCLWPLMLTKSLHKTGITCPKALWLSIHMPELKSAPSPTVQHRMSEGQAIGRLAQGLFPQGIEAPFFGLSTEQAAEATRQLMDQEQDVIFEATFVTPTRMVRVDILKRERGGWRVIEVKGSSQYRSNPHLEDVAFQVSVLFEAGVRVTGASLAHVNKEYVWAGGPFDLQQLFTVRDITDEVWAAVPDVNVRSDAFLDLWKEPEYPVRTGKPPYNDPGLRAACRDCEFGDHCFGRAPKDHIFFLGLHHTRYKKLMNSGIERVNEIPDGFVDDAKEILRRDAMVLGVPQQSEGLSEALERIRHPAYLLDFETLRPTLPLLPGMRAFELLPFQWSCHIVHEDGRVEHREFLHQEASDPRPAFVSSLCELLQEGASVVHYSSYEKTTINEMAKLGYPGSAELQAMIPDRFVDLEEILRNGYADAGFLGRTSIKAVLPVVAPHLSYKTLGIQNGEQAQIEYARTYSAACEPERRAQVFRDLLEYCKLDTLAMVEVLQHLRQVVRACAIRQMPD